MKKILFFFIFCIFISLFFIKHDSVIDKELTTNNIKVNYPYFSDYNINNYINNYINKNIKNMDNNLIIDYDYNDIGNILTFYKT